MDFLVTPVLIQSTFKNKTENLAGTCAMWSMRKSLTKMFIHKCAIEFYTCYARSPSPFILIKNMYEYITRLGQTHTNDELALSRMTYIFTPLFNRTMQVFKRARFLYASNWHAHAYTAHIQVNSIKTHDYSNYDSKKKKYISVCVVQLRLHSLWPRSHFGDDFTRRHTTNTLIN